MLVYPLNLFISVSLLDLFICTPLDLFTSIAPWIYLLNEALSVIAFVFFFAFFTFFYTAIVIFVYGKRGEGYKEGMNKKRLTDQDVVLTA